MTKPTISYPDELEELIQTLIEAGVVDSRSDFFQRSAGIYIGMLEPTIRGSSQIIEDAENIEVAQAKLDRVEQSLGELNP